jgi:hypothetical protein
MLGVILDKKIAWGLHIEPIEAEVFRTFNRKYSLFTSTNIKLTLHETLIRSVMTYVCPAWEFGTDTSLLKLRQLQNEVLRTINKFLNGAPVRKLHMAFQVLYIYDYITKFAGNKQTSYQITKIQMFAISEKAKPDIENIRSLNLAVIKCTTVQAAKLPL